MSVYLRAKRTAIAEALIPEKPKEEDRTRRIDEKGKGTCYMTRKEGIFMCSVKLT